VGLAWDMGGGSGAVGAEQGGMGLRRPAAEARRLLIAMASAKLNAPAAELTVTDGVVHAVADKTRRASYAELIGGRYFDDKLKWNGRLSSALAVEVEAPLRKHTEYKVIGRSPPR